MKKVQKNIFSKKDIKKNNIISLMIILLSIIIINIISSYVFFRFDLTSEKRYSLSQSTKKMLKGLDDIVYFKIYLDGDFPSGFKKLQKETKEILNEFRAYSDNIQYEFINPSEGKNKRETAELYTSLVKKGLQPSQIQNTTADGVSSQIIFPGAIVSYKQREIPLQLLISNISISPEEVINASVQSLEYNIASCISKLQSKTKPKIAFIRGHGELNDEQVFDIKRELSEFYSIENVYINEQINALRTIELDTNSGKSVVWNKYNLLIIAKPDSAFSNKDKFIIDQFIMRGGNVLWLIDPIHASLDSMKNVGESVGVIKELNLEDMFFKYGVRLNTNLLQDMNAVPIPINVGQMGNNAQINLIPWFYFPIITPMSDNPIVKNLNSIKTEFISSIDTVGSNYEIKKTILLTTSKYTKAVNAPAIISLNILKKKPDKREFLQKYLPVSVLCEGKFNSLYDGRLEGDMDTNKLISFVAKSQTPSKLIFVADGDIIKNQIDKQGPLPLGYDKYSQITYGNKEFILNAINYLCNDETLLQVRAREIKIRLLDKSRVLRDKLYWQLFNILTPIIFIAILGVILAYLRKRKYTITK